MFLIYILDISQLSTYLLSFTLIWSTFSDKWSNFCLQFYMQIQINKCTNTLAFAHHIPQRISNLRAASKSCLFLLYINLPEKWIFFMFPLTFKMTLVQGPGWTIYSPDLRSIFHHPSEPESGVLQSYGVFFTYCPKLWHTFAVHSYINATVHLSKVFISVLGEVRLTHLPHRGMLLDLIS